MPNKERLTEIKDFIKSLITTDLETSKITQYNDMVSKIDEAIDEDTKTNEDLVQAKDVIVKMVKKEGSSEPPRDESGGAKPRSLEEIAQSVINGGK